MSAKNTVAAANDAEVKDVEEPIVKFCKKCADEAHCFYHADAVVVNVSEKDDDGNVKVKKYVVSEEKYFCSKACLLKAYDSPGLDEFGVKRSPLSRPYFKYKSIKIETNEKGEKVEVVEWKSGYLFANLEDRTPGKRNIEITPQGDYVIRKDNDITVPRNKKKKSGVQCVVSGQNMRVEGTPVTMKYPGTELTPAQLVQVTAGRC